MSVTGRRISPSGSCFQGWCLSRLASIGLAPPVSLVTLALAAATALTFDGSLGTNGLIYDELYKYVLPFRGMRVPARFAAFVGTGLILLSAYGARRLLRLGRTRVSRGVIFAVLVACPMIELRPVVPIEPYPSRPFRQSTPA